MKTKLGLIFVIMLTFIQCKTEPKEITVETSAPEATVFELPTAPEGVIHVFTPLPYAYDALEPYIDAQTMEIHFSKHHVGYFKKFLEAIKGTDLEKTPIKDIFSKISMQSDAVRNTAGGYWNHDFFWSVMLPGGAKEPNGNLLEAINTSFGSFDAFKKEFSETGAKRFGSGWPHD